MVLHKKDFADPKGQQRCNSECTSHGCAVSAATDTLHGSVSIAREKEGNKYLRDTHPVSSGARTALCPLLPSSPLETQ